MRTGRAVALLALALAGIGSFTAAIQTPSANADTYTVDLCAGSGTSDGLTASDNPGVQGFMNTSNRCTDLGWLSQGAYLPNGYSSYTYDGDGMWRIFSPGGTTIQSLYATRAVAGWDNAGWLGYRMTTNDGRVLEQAGDAGTWGTSLGTSASYSVNSTMLQSHFWCTQGYSGCSAGNVYIQWSQIQPTLNDAYAPTLNGQPAGTLVAGGVLKGTKTVGYDASDAGGGVYRAALVIDGNQVASVTPDTNGGRCTRPFHYLVPCKLRVTGSIDFDTTTIADGAHTARVIAYDASNSNNVTSQTYTLNVDNIPPPQNTQTSRWTQDSPIDEPHPRDVVSLDRGVWAGGGITYTYRFKRCSLDGATCSVISSGSDTTYTVTAADIGSRLVGEVDAVNDQGTTTAVVPMTGAVTAQQSSADPPVEKPTDPTPTDPTTPIPTGPTPTVVDPPAPALPSTVTNSQTDRVAVPNGTCAGGRAQLVAAFGKQHRATTVRYGKGAKLTLSLTCVATRKAISGAVLTIATSNPTGKKATSGSLKTNAKGAVTLALPRGPSRTVAIGWRATSTAKGYAAQTTATLRVRAAVALKIGRRRVTNGHSVKFTGSIASAPAGIVLNVQALDGKKWRTFDQTRTTKGGKYRYTYKFKRITRAAAYFAFRASIAPNQAKLRLVPSSSRAIGVRVVP